MAGPSTGDAIFSTSLGRFPPREAGDMPARIVLRSVPEEDMEAKVAELQAKYPEHCKAITSPAIDLYKYFDNYDQQLHGERFLHAVLTQICERNLFRRQAVLEYAQAWSNLNQAASQYIHLYELNAFTDDDVEEYGADFLREVLEELQHRKAAYDEAIDRADEKVYIHHEQTHQAHTGPSPAFALHEQQPFLNDRRNMSAPISSHMSFVQPHWTPSMSSATPEMPRVNFPCAPIPRLLHGMDTASSRPTEQPPRSAPLYPSRRAEHYSDPTDSGITVPRNGFSDSIVAIPPPGLVGGPYSYHRVPAGPRLLFHPANTMRNPPKSRAPVYMGPSNDARVLEKQNVPRHRGSFGEGRMGRGSSQPYGQQLPYAKPYPPYQQNHPYGAPPQLSQPGPWQPMFGPHDFANQVELSDMDRAPAVAGQGSIRRNPRPAPRIFPDRANGAYDREHQLPAQPFTTPPRQDRDTMQAPSNAERHGLPDTMPPHVVYRKPKAPPVNGPTIHPVSNASNQPLQASPRTDHRGEHQYTPDSRAYRLERDDPVSDRKLWVGGLRPEANLNTVADLLKPWGPVTIGGMLVAKTQKDKQGQHNGFTFAEFEIPQNAAAATEALHDRYVEALGCKIVLKPAYLRPLYNNCGGSPQKNGVRLNDRSGRRGTIGSDMNELKRTGTRQSQVGVQGPVREHSNQPGVASKKRDNFSTEWPALGTNPPHAIPVTLIPDGVQAYKPQITDNPEEPPRLHTPKLNRTAQDSDSLKTEGNATRNPSDAQKVDETAVSPPKSKTLSPKKKKARKENKDEAAAGKSTQAKQRKNMLSNLRTEKLNAAVSNPITHTPNPSHDQQVQSAKGVDSEKDEKCLHDQEDTLSHARTPSAGFKEDDKAAATAFSDQPAGKISPVQSASTHDRRWSSASVTISTGLTSHAHSGQAESPTTDAHTSPTEMKDGPPVPALQPTRDSYGPVENSKLDNMLADAANLHLSTEDHVSGGLGDDVAKPSEDSRPPTAAVRLSDTAALEAQQPGLEPAKDNGGASSSIHVAKSPSSSEPEVNADAVSHSKEKLRPQTAKSEHVDDAKQTEQLDETASTQPGQKEIPSPTHVNLPGQNLLSASTQPNAQYQSDSPLQKASLPHPKRGLSRDPKVLIAVPRVLPPMQPKSQPRETHMKGVESTSKPKELTESPNEQQTAGAPAVLTVDAPQDRLDEQPASPSTVDGQHTPLSPAVEDDKASAVSSTDIDETADRLKETQVQVEDHPEMRQMISASNSVATVEDDPFDPDTTTPQKFAAALLKQEADLVAMQSSEQPPIQQKKKKTKKGKKKPKKSKASQPDSADTSNTIPAQPAATVSKEKAVMAPIVERPFVSDEGQELSQPLFTLRNHSSMRLRNGIGPKNPEQSTATISSSEHNAGNPVFPTMFLSPTYATPPAARTARPEALIIFSKESGGSDGTGEPETAQSRDEGHIVDADSPQVPQAASSTEPNESENVALPTDNSQNHDIETPHEDSQPPYTVDEATPEGRREHVKKYLEENNIPTRFTMINLLDKMATQRVTDNVRNTSTGLPSKGTSDLDGLDGPRIEEICKDETQDLPAPTAPLKERAQRMLPSRDTSPDPPAEDPSKAMTVTPRLDEPDLEANTSDRNERVAASFPSTRRTSPERGRFRSVSPAKGLGLSEIRQPSDNRENISPSRPPPNKTLSYKQVAITSSTPPIQPGEIVELVPHDNGQSGKEGQGVKVIRSMGSKDPWRVPSSEQPWGANNKSRANSSAKASEPLP